MLTKVESFAVRPSTPSLSLDIGAESSVNPIQLRGVDGLGPVAAAITTSPYAAVDAEELTGASVGKRNIVMRFGLNADWATWTVAELRQELYRYFMPKVTTRLRFHSSHLPICEISGMVESVEPNIFAKDPEVQVSVLCPNPDFVSLTESAFEGVVTNGSIITVVEYEGSAPTGFVLDVRSSTENPSYEGPVLIRVDEVDFELFPLTIDEGRYIEIGSIPGQRYAREITIPDGDVSNLLVAMAVGSTWPMLTPGPNDFQVIASESDQVWNLSYFPRFGGL